MVYKCFINLSKLWLRSLQIMFKVCIRVAAAFRIRCLYMYMHGSIPAYGHPSIPVYMVDVSTPELPFPNT